jgi:hypothetical protein
VISTRSDYQGRQDQGHLQPTVEDEKKFGSSLGVDFHEKEPEPFETFTEREIYHRMAGFDVNYRHQQTH